MNAKNALLFLVLFATSGLRADSLSFSAPIPVQVELKQHAATELRNHNLAVADVDGDGHVDLIVNNLGDLVLLPGHSDGTFGAPHLIESVGAAGRIVVADLNVDGAPDLLVQNSADGGFTVLLNMGGGSFSQPDVYSRVVWSATAPAVLDVDGDGIPDVVVGDSDYRSRQFVLLLGKGDGSFRQSTSLSLTTTSWPEGPVRLMAVDLDCDGFVDILAKLLDGTILALYGSGEHGFGSPVEILPWSATYALAAADLNGDGRPDVLFSNSAAVYWLPSLGGGSYGKIQGISAPNPAEPPSAFLDIVVADLNADGAVDVLGVNQEQPFVRVFLGAAGGHFDSGHDLQTNVRGSAEIAIADTNGDGRPDLIIAGNDPNTITLLLNSSAPRPPRIRTVHH